jgi:hypothetical protein
VLGGGWCSFDPPRSHEVGLWKNIRRGWRFFFSHTRFEPGDGSNIRFWNGFWCGGMTLKKAFPNLYNIARLKDASIAINLDFSSESLQ